MRSQSSSRSSIEAHPLAWLQAEVDAWPFLSLRAFREDLIYLDWSSIAGQRNPSPFAAELEDRVRTRARGLSLNALSAMRDSSWFAPAGNSRSVTQYLLELARRRLAIEESGPRVASGSADSASRNSMHWRWLSLRLPSDLLVAGAYANMGLEPDTDDVELATPQLARLLASEPVASTHLHAKAALAFPAMWTALVGSGDPAARISELPGSAPFGGGIQLRIKLVAAAFTRICLAFVLSKLRSNKTQGFLSGYDEFVHAASIRATPSLSTNDVRRLFERTFACLGAEGETQRDLANCRRALALVCRIDRAPSKTLGDLLAQDPVGAVFDWRSGRALAETKLLAAALQWLGANEREIEFSKIFWRYVRIRCSVFCYVTHEPGTSGLEWFQRHYDRLKSLRGGIDPHLVESAIRVEGRGINLGAIELRYEPPRDAGELSQLVRNHVTAMAIAQSRIPETGIVFHFLKQKHTKHGELSGAPEKNLARSRYADWFVEQRNRALTLAGFIRRLPSSLLIIRGLDVAGTERAIPSWVVTPLFRIVRNASAQAAHRLRMQGRQIPGLQLTVHAGEDYGVLIEGLRRIDEMLDELRPGDRIGHGLALGESPLHALRRSEGVPQTREEKAENLLWELQCYQDGRVRPVEGRAERVRQLLRRILHPAFGEFSIDDHVEARRLRGRPEYLDAISYPYLRRPLATLGAPGQILLKYLTSSATFWAMQEFVEDDCGADDLAASADLQRWLRGEVAKREITIESNPSSNMLVLDSSGLDTHPAITLTGAKDSPPVRVSINSDDPLTFATAMPDEYARLFLAQLSTCASSHEALEWVDRLRRAGWLSRFTLPESSNRAALLALARELMSSLPS